MTVVGPYIEELKEGQLSLREHTAGRKKGFDQAIQWIKQAVKSIFLDSDEAERVAG